MTMFVIWAPGSLALGGWRSLYITDTGWEL